jgi:hypothetical protein
MLVALMWDGSTSRPHTSHDLCARHKDDKPCGQLPQPAHLAPHCGVTVMCCVFPQCPDLSLCSVTCDGLRPPLHFSLIFTLRNPRLGASPAPRGPVRQTQKEKLMINIYSG